MARKFWERVNNNKIQFYDEPSDLQKDVMDARIAELQEVLAQPDHIKAMLVQAFPSVSTEAEFNAIFEDELAALADQRDYYDNDNVTTQEVIDVIDYRWMSPADMSLGAGVVVSACGEEVGNEAIGAIDSIGGNSWQHDVDHVHEILFDLGYVKRIDGIRVRNTATPGDPLQLSGVQVYVAGSINNLDSPGAYVGTDLEFTDPSDNDRDLTPRNGRYIKVVIGSTAHTSNHITVRDIELRTRPRTFGL